MAQIKNKKKYPLITPKDKDFLVATQDSTGKTRSISVEGLSEHIIAKVPNGGGNAPIKDIKFKGESLPVVDKTVELPYKLSEFDNDLDIETKESVENIKTIADLRLREGKEEGEIVRLLGYYEAGDKPELLYKYSSGTGEEDGGSVINTSEGKWEALFGHTVDIKDFGVKIDNIDNSGQINKASLYCKLNNKTILFSQGEFSIKKTIHIYTNSVNKDCTINVFENPTVAIEIGSDELTETKDIQIPDLINKSKPPVGYVGVGTGVKVFTLYSSRVYLNKVHDFSEGLFVSAKQNKGCSYNTFFIGHLINNKENIKVYPEENGGWCNENIFMGGRCSKRSHEVGNGGFNKVDIVNGGTKYTTANVVVENPLNGSGFEASAEIVNGVISKINIIRSGTGYNRNSILKIEGDGEGAYIRGVVCEEGSTHISLLENTSKGGGADNNLFLHVSIEDNNVDTTVLCEGMNNVFKQVRWESNRPKILFKKISVSDNGGSRNTIEDGYGVDRLFIVTEGGRPRFNQINRLSRGQNIESFNQSFRLRSSNATSVIQVFDSVPDFYNSNYLVNNYNNWNVDLGKDGLKIKSQNDKYPNIELESASGRIYLGDGNTENIPFITAGKLSPEGVIQAPIGSLYINMSGSGALNKNLYQKTANPSSKNGWEIVGHYPVATITTGGIVKKAKSIDETPTLEALISSLKTAGIIE